MGGIATAAAAGLVPRAEAAAFAIRPGNAPSNLPPAQNRRNASAAIRHQAESYNRRVPVPAQTTNGDEDRYPARLASFSKGLPHDALGEVDRNAHLALLEATASGRHEDFEAIPMGCSVPSQRRPLVNPMAGVAFDIQGVDSHQLGLPPAPAFASAELASEMTELYWMALLRDVNFTDYGSHADVATASAELSNLLGFRGPRIAGSVTAQSLFRDNLPGCLTGPYISQFLLRPTPFGAEHVERRMRTLLPGSDQVTDYATWLDIQNGCTPLAGSLYDPVRRLIRNGRDLSEWVHIDVLFQAYFNAALILLAPPDPSDGVTGGGLGAPLSPSNPYHGSATQQGFGTFGAPHVATLVCEPATRALKAVWYQKWYVHRRLRPEAFGGRVHNHVTSAASYPIHADVLNSTALSRVFSANGTYLLPLAFPEGSPMHPSYGAGHATVAGACVTMLKAMFDESYVIPDPVVPSADGLALVPYTGPGAGNLTVGGELNKLASNVATGRNIAGVHWRSDGIESLRLGEQVAIGILRDQRATFKESFAGFSFTRFDGTPITI